MGAQDRYGSRNLPPVIPPAVRAGDQSELSPINSIALPPDLPPAIPLDRIRSVQDSVLTRRGDILQITTYSSVVATLQIVTRTYVNGEISVGTLSFATDGTRNPQVTTLALTDGLLIGVQLLVTSGTVLRGTVFCKGIVLQGSGTSQTQIGIISNYVTTNNQISYPTSALINSTEGDGFLTSATFPVSPGGAILVPINTLWRVVTGQAFFQASAVAANRNIEMQQNLPGPTTAVQSIPRRLQVANENIFYHFGVYSESTALFTDAAGTIHWWVLIPQLKLRRGGFLNMNVVNAQAGDALSAYAVIEEWMDV